MPTVSTFPEGLHLCMSHELYNYNYTNAILQENHEDPETNTVLTSCLVYFSQLHYWHFSGGLHLCTSRDVELLLHKRSFPGKPGTAY